MTISWHVKPFHVGDCSKSPPKSGAKSEFEDMFERRFPLLSFAYLIKYDHHLIIIWSNLIINIMKCSSFDFMIFPVACSRAVMLRPWVSSCPWGQALAIATTSAVSDSGAGQLGWSLLEEYSRAGRDRRSGDLEMSQAAETPWHPLDGSKDSYVKIRWIDMPIFFDMLIDMLSILVTALDISKHL